MSKMTWPEFRASHKGKKQKEISALWKIYKDSPENEVLRNPAEQKVLNRLNVKQPERGLGLKRFLY